MQERHPACKNQRQLFLEFLICSNSGRELKVIVVVVVFLCSHLVSYHFADNLVYIFCNISGEMLQNVQADYSMESHARDLDNYVNVARNRRRRAKALLDFERHDDDELGFRKNDIITVSSFFVVLSSRICYDIHCDLPQSVSLLLDFSISSL